MKDDNDAPDNLRRLAEDVRQHLHDNEGELAYWSSPIPSPFRERAGVRETTEAAVATVGTSIRESASGSMKKERAEVSADALTPTLSLKGEGVGANEVKEGSKAQQLDSLFREEIGDCHRCPLGDSRIKLVFGVGNPEARVMFVGEGPGYDEDRKGEPFVGRAGQLLDKIMAAIDLDRTKVYIANVVKCHPMKNPSTPDARGNDRPPTPEESEQCIPFLKKQISVIQPEIVVTLGSTAMKAILGPVGAITQVRGKIFSLPLDDGSTIPILPTFHPAALLRDPSLKKFVWEDMKQLRERLKNVRGA